MPPLGLRMQLLMNWKQLPVSHNAAPVDHKAAHWCALWFSFLICTVLHLKKLVHRSQLHRELHRCYFSSLFLIPLP